MTATVDPSGRKPTKSKTYWGMFIMAVSYVASQMTPEQTAVVKEWLTAYIPADLITFIGGLVLAIYGRNTANLPIEWPWSKKQ